MKGQPTLLAIDLGTTSTRAIIFSAGGDILQLAQKEVPLSYPHKGWVEQNPEQIWRETLACCQQVLQKSPQLPLAIGISCQRETTLVWDRESGQAIYEAIVWQDRRSSKQCQSLRQAGHEESIVHKTGLLLDPYFSATKLAWILDHVEGARERAANGQLAFGTPDAYLLWKLTGGKVHATDITNASRTMLYNIVEQKWDEDLLALFDIPEAILPRVRDNVADFGITSSKVLGFEIPIGGMAGDQQSALIGQACLSPGMIKSTYGTGCFALMHAGSVCKASRNRLLTTVAYRINGDIHYAIEGSIFSAGSTVQWLRDDLEIIASAQESESLALSVNDNNDVYFVPAFTGLGAPYWRPDAHAMITGITRETGKAHIVRAALEAQAYQTLDLIGAMEEDSGRRPEVIRADGGMMANGFVCQFLADMIQRPVEVPAVVETTAWGAAILAGVYAGVFEDLDAVGAKWRPERRYEPGMPIAERDRLYAKWRSAVEMLLR